MGIIVTISSGWSTVSYPASADESTPFTATRRFFVSSVMVSFGFIDRRCSSKALIGMPSRSTWTKSVPNDFLAPPRNLIESNCNLVVLD